MLLLTPALAPVSELYNFEESSLLTPDNFLFQAPAACRTSCVSNKPYHCAQGTLKYTEPLGRMAFLAR